MIQDLLLPPEGFISPIPMADPINFDFATPQKSPILINKRRHWLFEKKYFILSVLLQKTYPHFCLQEAYVGWKNGKGKQILGKTFSRQDIRISQLKVRLTLSYSIAHAVLGMIPKEHGHFKWTAGMFPDCPQDPLNSSRMILC